MRETRTAPESSRKSAENSKPGFSPLRPLDTAGPPEARRPFGQCFGAGKVNSACRGSPVDPSRLNSSAPPRKRSAPASSRRPLMIRAAEPPKGRVVLCRDRPMLRTAHRPAERCSRVDTPPHPRRFPKRMQHLQHVHGLSRRSAGQRVYWIIRELGSQPESQFPAELTVPHPDRKTVVTPTKIERDTPSAGVAPSRPAPSVRSSRFTQSAALGIENQQFRPD